MPIVTQTTTPANDVFSSAADVLATMLTPELKDACDRILGEQADSRDRWALYQTTLTHHQHREIMK